MSNAYAALFAIADADRDGVCGREEGFRFFQRFSVTAETLEEVIIFWEPPQTMHMSLTELSN